jgi:uncharacterized protein with HEPN domain
LKETRLITYEDFISNELLKRGCTRSFEIIGEAVKHISSGLKNKYKDIEWRKIAGMRDRIIHYYFGVNYNIVWQTIKDKLPELKRKIKDVINTEGL